MGKIAMHPVSHALADRHAANKGRIRDTFDDTHIADFTFDDVIEYARDPAYQCLDAQNEHLMVARIVGAIAAAIVLGYELGRAGA